MPKILNALELNQNELRKAVAERLSTAPASPVQGQFYWDTTLNKLRFYDGSAWVNQDAGAVTSVAATAPMQSTGGQTPTISIAPATGAMPGSLSAADKTKLDAATAIKAASALVLRDSSGAAALDVTGNVAGTASNASNLGSQSPSFYQSRSNHTGTQTASTIFDFDAQVRTSRLDQLVVPNTSLSIGGNKLTGVADGTNNSDAATWGQTQALFNGSNNKGTARAASTANVSLSAPGAAIDGVTLVANDIILLKDQTTGGQNGLYVWAGASTALVRATNADTSAEVKAGLFVFASEGTTNGNNGFSLTTDDPIVLGTTALTFTQVSGAGQIIAGAGLAKTGNQLDVGQGTGIIVSADSIAVDPAVVVRKFAQNLGDGTSTSIAVTHNLGTRDITWAVYLNSGSFEVVMPDCQFTSANVLTLVFGTAPTANQYRVVVQG